MRKPPHTPPPLPTHTTHTPGVYLRTAVWELGRAPENRGHGAPAHPAHPAQLVRRNGGRGAARSSNQQNGQGLTRAGGGFATQALNHIRQPSMQDGPIQLAKVTRVLGRTGSRGGVTQVRGRISNASGHSSQRPSRRARQAERLTQLWPAVAQVRVEFLDDPTRSIVRNVKVRHTTRFPPGCRCWH